RAVHHAVEITGTAVFDSDLVPRERGWLERVDLCRHRATRGTCHTAVTERARRSEHADDIFQRGPAGRGQTSAIGETTHRYTSGREARGNSAGRIAGLGRCVQVVRGKHSACRASTPPRSAERR